MPTFNPFGDRRRFVKTIVSGSLILLVLHTLAMISTYGFGRDYVKGLVPLFNFETEFNAPTLWSVFLFLSAAIALYRASRRERSPINVKYWLGLALVFVALASDELFQLHEKFNAPTQRALDTSGLLYYAWILPMLGIVAVLSLIFLRFYLRLPRRTQLLFIASFALFMFGAVGLEMFEGKINEAGGYQSLPYMVLVTIEETAEMLAICLFIHSVLEYEAGQADHA